MAGLSDILSALQNGVVAIRNLDAATTTGSSSLITALDSNSSALVTAISSGLARLAHWGGPWISYTPTVTSGTGALTTASGSGYYNQMGKTISLSAFITITTNGTGATDLRFTLPFAINVSMGYSFAGIMTGAKWGIASEAVSATSSQIVFYKYDGTYPGADGNQFLVTGTYWAA